MAIAHGDPPAVMCRAAPRPYARIGDRALDAWLTSSRPTTCTALPRPPEVQRVQPSGEMAKPIGRAASPGGSSSPLRACVCACVDDGEGMCGFSRTNARSPSRVKMTARGRPPVPTCATDAPVSISRTDTELSRIPTPSGPLPTGTRRTTWPVSRSTSDASALSAFSRAFRRWSRRTARDPCPQGSRAGASPTTGRRDANAVGARVGVGGVGDIDTAASSTHRAMHERARLTTTGCFSSQETAHSITLGGRRRQPLASRDHAGSPENWRGVVGTSATQCAKAGFSLLVSAMG